jgi:hypothetical protein
MNGTEKETKTMSIEKSSDESVRNNTEAHYEELASQEEIYLEEREERARAVLISENPSGLSSGSGSPEAKRSVTDASNTPAIADNVDKQLDHAAEELITGDSDDPPLSDEAVVKMLRAS